MGLSVAYVFVSVINFLRLEFFFQNFCRAGFVDTYCEYLALSLNILFFPSIVIESFAGYSSLVASVDS